MPDTGPKATRAQRQCETCGKALAQKPNERQDRFAWRKFCGRTCYRRKPGGFNAVL